MIIDSNRPAGRPIMSAVLALARLIRRGRYVILFAWVLVSVAGLVWGLKLLSATNNIYNAPPGAPSAVATAAYTSAFQDKTGQTWITVRLVGAGGRAGSCWEALVPGRPLVEVRLRPPQMS